MLQLFGAIVTLFKGTHGIKHVYTVDKKLKNLLSLLKIPIPNFIYLFNQLLKAENKAIKQFHTLLRCQHMPWNILTLS